MLGLLVYMNVIAAAAVGGSEELLHFYPAQVLRHEVVHFKPTRGHHFSASAPQTCGAGSLLLRSIMAIKCQFNVVQASTVTLNVCDDKETFCRTLELPVGVDSQTASNGPSELIKNESLTKKLKQMLLPGFVEGSPQEIGAQAAANPRPVFVLISTDWCPPCNETKEFILSSPAFQSATKNWLKVYVNGDSLSAADWEKTTPFRFYPSFVLLNSRMEEVGRYTGELRQRDFLTWTEQMMLVMNDPIPMLRKAVLDRRKGSWKQKWRDFKTGVSREQMAQQEERLLAWALDRDERDLIPQLLKEHSFPKLQTQVLRFQLKEVERQERQDGKDAKIAKAELFTQLLAATLRGEHWGELLQGFCDMDVTRCKPYLDKIPERIDFIKNRSELQESERDSQLADEYYYLSEVHQAVADKKGMKEFALKCADHFALLKRKSSLKISRVANQGMVACLELAEAYPREREALNALIQAYPEEPTFYWRMARMQRKEKKFKEALASIARAEKFAYGYNWFSLQMLKAEINLDLKKGGAARQVLSAALAQATLDGGQDSRNQGLVGRLRGLQAKAQESLN